jgi:O-antigen ligase
LIRKDQSIALELIPTVQPSSQASFSKPIEPVIPAPKASRRTRRSTLDLDRWLERGILGLVLFAVVFGPLAFGAVDLPQLLVLEWVTACVLVLWVVRSWADPSSRLLWPPICWSVLLFLGYAGFRYAMVVDEGGIEYLARQEVILVAMYGFLFFAVLNNLSRQECAQTLSVTLFGLATLLSVYAVYQFLTKSGRVLWVPQYPGYLGRGSGTYMCPNHLAGLLEMVLPLALAFTLTGRSKPTTKVFFGYASVAIFAGIGVTLSRGGWVASGAALLVFFGLLMRKRGQRLAGVIFLALLVGGSVFFVKNLGALQRRKDVAFNENQGSDTRFELWKPAVKIWKDHVWWGAGPAHFDDAFRAYRPDDLQMRPLYAHNDYLNT